MVLHRNDSNWYLNKCYRNSIQLTRTCDVPIRALSNHKQESREVLHLLINSWCLFECVEAIVISGVYMLSGHSVMWTSKLAGEK